MYTRRLVWFDKQGRRNVTWRSMGADSGDAGIELDAPGTSTPAHPDCPGEASWNEQLQRCVSPDEGSPAASVANVVTAGVQTLKNALSTLFSGGSPPAPPPTVAATQAAPNATMPVSASAAATAGAGALTGMAAVAAVGGVAFGVYYLWKRKKRS